MHRAAQGSGRAPPPLTARSHSTGGGVGGRLTAHRLLLTCLLAVLLLGCAFVWAQAWRQCRPVAAAVPPLVDAAHRLAAVLRVRGAPVVHPTDAARAVARLARLAAGLASSPFHAAAGPVALAEALARELADSDAAAPGLRNELADSDAAAPGRRNELADSDAVAPGRRDELLRARVQLRVARGLNAQGWRPAAHAQAPAADAPPASTAAPPRGGSDGLGDGRAGVDDRFSHQTCYLDGDESELCVYSGTVCFAGNDPALVAAEAPPVGPTNPIHDPSGDCIDYRHTEVSTWSYSSCRYDKSGDRKFGVGPPRPGTDFPVDVTTRYLGPNNRRDVAVHLITPAQVFPDEQTGWGGLAAGRWAGSPRASLAAGVPRGDATHIVPPDARDVRADGSFEHPAVPGLRVAARVRSAAGGLVDFVDGALWMVPINSRAFANPYMFMAGASKLWAAQRNNATHPAPGQAGSGAQQPARVGGLAASGGVGFGAHPADGYIHAALPPGVPPASYYGQRRSVHRSQRVVAADAAAPQQQQQQPPATSESSSTSAWVVGPQWGPLPPMDTVVFLGIGGQDISHTGNLTRWLRGALGLMLQPHTRTFFADLRKQYSKDHLLCAASGVWGSQRPRLFAAHADGWMFRQHAYQSAGLSARGLHAHPAHPPRRITVLDRRGQHGRSFFNRDDVLQQVGATGLPVRVIDAMHELSFEEQVAAMANTGILVAPHGAALMNVVFLPAHAVVIEVFSPLMKNDVYRRLAASVGVSYVSLHSRHVLPHELHQFSGVQIIHNKSEFVSSCVGKNASSYDGMLLAYCNRASKGHPVVVPQRALRRALADAIDAIGAFSLTNPAWAAANRDDEWQGGDEGGVARSRGAAAHDGGSGGAQPGPRGHWFAGPDPDIESLPAVWQAAAVAEAALAAGAAVPGDESVREFRRAMEAAIADSEARRPRALSVLPGGGEPGWEPLQDPIEEGAVT